MNRLVFTGVRSTALAALCLAAPGGRTFAAESSQKAAREAAAVERVIRAAAQAFSDFPRTLDSEAVLSFYARGFSGIENGEETSLQDQRDLLADLADQLASGIHVILALRATNVRVRVLGQTAVATYDYSFRIGVAGDFVDEEEGKCTSILERSGGTWLFRHEHCSSACPPCDDEELDEDVGPQPPERTAA